MKAGTTSTIEMQEQISPLTTATDSMEMPVALAELLNSD